MYQVGADSPHQARTYDRFALWRGQRPLDCTCFRSGGRFLPLDSTDGGPVLGLVDGNWFAAQLQSILASSNVSPATLPIVISTNVYLYLKSIDNCCITGFHGAGHPTGPGAGSHPRQRQTAGANIRLGLVDPNGQNLRAGPDRRRSAQPRNVRGGHDPFVSNYMNPRRPQASCNTAAATSWRPATRWWASISSLARPTPIRPSAQRGTCRTRRSLVVRPQPGHKRPTAPTPTPAQSPHAHPAASRPVRPAWAGRPDRPHPRAATGIHTGVRTPSATIASGRLGCP